MCESLGRTTRKLFEFPYEMRLVGIARGKCDIGITGHSALHHQQRFLKPHNPRIFFWHHTHMMTEHPLKLLFPHTHLPGNVTYPD